MPLVALARLLWITAAKGLHGSPNCAKVLIGLICACGTVPASAQVPAADLEVIEAREALRRGDKARLAQTRDRLLRSAHPLAQWADYWALSANIAQAQADEVEQFYQRWPSTYVEDRLRNDWLLELGRRRDWSQFLQEMPRFRMNDDREVNCYSSLARAQTPSPSQAPSGATAGLNPESVSKALAVWRDHRDGSEACFQLALQLREAGQLPEQEIWQQLRLAIVQNRPRTARQTAQLLGPGNDKLIDRLWEKPSRFLARLNQVERSSQGAWGTLAVLRLAASEPVEAAEQLQQAWAQSLRPEWAAAAWGGVARQGALRLLPEAVAWADKAMALNSRLAAGQGLTDDQLTWIARIYLRQTGLQPEAWLKVGSAIDSMSATTQNDPTWVFWKARSSLARGRTGSGAEAQASQARERLQAIASPLHFYGQLALEELGQALALPSPSAALRPDEREPVAMLPGLQRALRLMNAGLRSEGVREWNFTLLGMNDRQLLAAAHLACEREVWDRCISASDRAQLDIDVALRYPLAFQGEIAVAAQRARLEPALLLGLIRQESRFVLQARSHVGASGLMQVMPTTARWTAKRIGIELGPQWREDRATNLSLGAAYLRMVMDDFGGSLPMALAAYNAGPGRPRRWREGPVLEPAIWAESIPIHETRDYVKKVLSNRVVYAQRLDRSAGPSLKALLGPAIGPRDPQTPEPNKDLP
jgi:soluble lytic murein transglycosylase